MKPKRNLSTMIFVQAFKFRCNELRMKCRKCLIDTWLSVLSLVSIWVCIGCSDMPLASHRLSSSQRANDFILFYHLQQLRSRCTILSMSLFVHHTYSTAAKLSDKVIRASIPSDSWYCNGFRSLNMYGCVNLMPNSIKHSYVDYEEHPYRCVCNNWLSSKCIRIPIRYAQMSIRKINNFVEWLWHWWCLITITTCTISTLI